MAKSAAPKGYSSVTPYLIVEDAAGLLDFMRTVFDAEDRMRMDDPDGRVAHAESAIGESIVMVGGASDRWPARPGVLHVYVADCDATYRRALDAGAESVQEPADQFYGDRMAGVGDVYGNTWWLATRVEDVSEDELARRAEEWAAQRES